MSHSNGGGRKRVGPGAAATASGTGFVGLPSQTNAITHETEFVAMRIARRFRLTPAVARVTAALAGFGGAR